MLNPHIQGNQYKVGLTFLKGVCIMRAAQRRSFNKMREIIVCAMRSPWKLTNIKTRKKVMSLTFHQITKHTNTSNDDMKIWGDL